MIIMFFCDRFQLLNIEVRCCRFVKDELHIEERKKDSFRGHPAERLHGEVVILLLSDSELLCKVLEGMEGMEGMAGIEFSVVFPVAAFDLSIVSGGERS